MIAMYDLNDDFIIVFETYKECAKYFNTSVKCMHSTMSRLKKGIRIKKRDRRNKRWVKLFKIGDLDEK